MLLWKRKQNVEKTVLEVQEGNMHIYLQKVYVKNITFERYEAFDSQFALWHLIADKKQSGSQDFVEQVEFYATKEDYNSIKKNGYYMA